MIFVSNIFFNLVQFSFTNTYKWVDKKKLILHYIITFIRQNNIFYLTDVSCRNYAHEIIKLLDSRKIFFIGRHLFFIELFE